MTSLAYQLTLQNPPYKRLVTEVIEKDPTVLTSLDRRRQFQELILKPFSSLKHEGEELTKLLILIDGLDECQGEEAQLDLPPRAPSQGFFRKNDISTICVRRDLFPNEPGADADVKSYLVDRLTRLMKNPQGSSATSSTSILSGDSETVKKLVHFVSEIFVIASSMLAFICDNSAYPGARLQTILNVIDGSVANPGTDNFLAPIDGLYASVLGEVENDRCPTALRLLGSCAASPRIPALQLANLLNITQEDFYNALRPLHAFVSVPHPTMANKESLHFFHASFPDFLSHYHRSREYYQDPAAHRLALADACFCILNSTNFIYSQGLSWLPPDQIEDDEDDEDNVAPSALSISYDISTFAATHLWEICMQIMDRPGVEFMLKMVTFDFRRLRPFSDVLPAREFIRFVRSLYALGNKVPESIDFVRTTPVSNMDEQLLLTCTLMTEPLSLKDTEVDELEKSPRHVLVGFEMKTILILFIPEVVMMYSKDDFDVCGDNHPETCSKSTDDALTTRWQQVAFLLL